MTWLFIVMGLVAAAALGLWWLERPLWYQSDGVRALENFLRDLVSPLSPWPLMHVDARGKQRLVFSRERLDEKTFRLHVEAFLEESNGDSTNALFADLEESHFSADRVAMVSETGGSRVRVEFGPVDGSVLAEATQAARIILQRLGVQEDERLRVRYTGTMDTHVVAPGLEDLEQRGGPLARLVAKAGLKHLRRQ